jgi:zinc protease
MPLFLPDFKIHKKVLANGLTILTKPVRHIPRVEAHLWYSVGSKDEAHNERGMAHLIEHMLFKGTQKLSESDINLVTQKLTSDANAFTSQDYTCYTFRLPSHVWAVAAEMMADCMVNAKFDEQMLASELKAVIEELRMYKDDFQGVLLENMLASVFPEHPYGNPIIGSKFDLCSLTRNDLYAFYKKHYHPKNATLVVVGDVEPEEVFSVAEKYFGTIPSPIDYVKPTFYLEDDLVSRATTLYRPVTNQWYCYIYKMPGFRDGKNHLLDIASLIFASGNSSRLYRRLVNEEQVAIDIECSVYDLVDKGLICIGIWPTEGTDPLVIEELMEEEITKLQEEVIEAWEFEAAQKRTQIDFTTLLESIEKQAFVIGNSYLAIQDEGYVKQYLHDVAHTTKQELMEFFQDYFHSRQQHKGYLLPLHQNDEAKLAAIQASNEVLEQQILAKHQRDSAVEPGVWVNSIPTPAISTFSYPKPKSFTLANGLEIIYHHNPLVPQVVAALSFKGNYLYETEEEAGGIGVLLRIITDSTADQTPDEFARMLDSQGIHLAAGSDNIATRALTNMFPHALEILANVVKKPALRKESIEKVRQQTISELDEFWESPIDFIDQLVKELMYGQHPYHKNGSGTKKSIEELTKKQLELLASKYISPDQACLVIVGDLAHLDLKNLIEQTFGSWKGPHIQDLLYTPIPATTADRHLVNIARDQTVLGLVAPSIARTHEDYNALALLDIILTGGSVASPSSRLFQLREKSGLFYMIGGSLIYGSRDQEGLSFIKTITTPDKVATAEKLIIDTLNEIAQHGITQEEFDIAKNLYFASSVELFESNAQMTQTFLFLKKLNLSFNLFDKQGEILSILKLDHVNMIAKKYCTPDRYSVVQIGRVGKALKKSL